MKWWENQKVKYFVLVHTTSKKKKKSLILNLNYEYFNLKSYCLINDCAVAGHITC